MTLLYNIIENNKLSFALAVLLAGALIGWLALTGPGSGAMARAVPDSSKAADFATQTAPAPTVESAGVEWHGAKAWHEAGFKGRGIKVGIIDAGFDGIGPLMGSELPQNTPASGPGGASGEQPSMPADIRVHINCYEGNTRTNDIREIDHCYSYETGSGTASRTVRSDHGNEVAQTLIDVAPEATLYIANPPAKYPNLFTETVEWMVNQGVDIIVHSKGSDMFAPGNGNARMGDTHSVLNAINTAVTGGILWVNSGGNKAGEFWYGEYEDSVGNNSYHEFAGGHEGNRITLTSGQTAAVSMRWDDKWGYKGTPPQPAPEGASCDLQLEIMEYDEEGYLVTVSDGENSQQNGYYGNLPIEKISYTAPAAGSYYIYIKKNSTSSCSPDWMQLRSPVAMEFKSSGYEIIVPAESNNSGMMAAGAATERNSTVTTIESYSSRGPAVDGRSPKPEIVGFTCGETTISTQFCGTSAAAPHVAGLAALVMSRYTTTYRNNPVALANYLKTNAAPRGAVGADNTWGYGFAVLPGARLEPNPATIVAGSSPTEFTVKTTIPSPGVRVSVTTPHLSVGSCPPGNTNYVTRVNDGKVSLRGCTAGTATVRLYKSGGNTLLQTYTVKVQSQTPAATPVASLSGLTLSAGTLSPAFASGTTPYTARVPNNVSRITVTPTTTTPGATIRVGTSTVSSGSGRAVNLSVGTNAISIVVSATGYTTRTYTITVTRAAATPVASLSGLTISSGTLAPAFASGKTSYTVQVPNNISRITVTPTTTTPGATIEIDDRVVSSGSGRAVNLIVGDTIIRLEVAATGYTTRNYTITVTRARPTPVASLSVLTISSGTLAPVFASGKTDYAAQVANNISSVTITPTTTTPGATIRVGTSTVSSGSASGAVSLSVGSNAIRIAVSATGYTTRNYTLTVTRAAAPLRPPTNLSLSAVSGHTDRLELTYTRSPETIHRYQFELHYLNKLTGKYVNYQSRTDSQSPETFRSVGRGYWYKARGRNCRNTSQADTCGVWSDWSSQVEFSNPSIAISGLTGSYIAGDIDPFSVTLSDLTLDQPYTVTFTSSQSSVIGFNYLCNQLPTAGFNAPANSHTVRFTLHACQITGNTATAQSGTVTAKLWKGVARGNPLDSATANATVTKATGSLSPVPSAITVGQDQTFTVTTNVPNNPGIWVAATVSGDAGRTTLPPDWGCLSPRSGRAAVNGNTVTLRGCRAGTATLTLYRSNSSVLLKSYTVTVNASATSLSPTPAAITVGQDQTFTLTTDAPNNPGVWITATIAGDAGRTTLPPNWGCLSPSSGRAAVSGNTVTLRGCRAGTATITIYRSNSSVLLKSYTVTVAASNTSLSPTPAAITVGQDQTFTLTTDAPNNPGVWITATITGDPGRTTLPPTRGCLSPSSGRAAVNGNTVTLRGCRAGTATITIYRSNSSVLLKSYTVTVAASATSLSPTPATFTIGTNQTFTLTTDIANTPGVWVGLNYNSADTGRLVLPNQSCAISSAGTAAVNGGSIALKPCTAGTVTIKVNRSYSSVTLVTYTVTINSS